MTQLIIVGAGGFGLEVAAYAADIAKYQPSSPLVPIGFWDDTKPVGSRHAGLPVLGPVDGRVDPEIRYIIAIGDPAGRKTVANKLQAHGAKFAKLLHPAAYIADSSQIGDGSIFAPFSFAGPESKVGEHVLMNIYASVAHESSVGNFCSLCPYAGTHACAVLEEGAFLGAQSVVTKNVHVGAGAKIAAGAVAYNDIPAGANALGNPARFRT